MDIVTSVLTMRMDIYVQSDSQDENTGAIKREWNYSSTMDCHVKGVISNSVSVRSGDQQVMNSKYKNEQTLQIRTLEKLSLRQKITNIRNKNGDYLWTELDYPSDTPTVFEIIGSTPIMDPFGTIIGYNSTAKRSENQQIGI
jgi:hypothetical protein